MNIGKLFNVVLYLLIALLAFYLLFHTFPGVFSGLGEGAHVALYAFLANLAAGLGLSGRILGYTLAILVLVVVIINFGKFVAAVDRLIAIYGFGRNKHHYDLGLLLQQVQYEIEQLGERIARTEHGMREAAQNMNRAKDGTEKREWSNQGQRLGAHMENLEKSLAGLQETERKLEAQLNVLPARGRAKRSAQINTLMSNARGAIAVARTYLP